MVIILIKLRTVAGTFFGSLRWKLLITYLLIGMIPLMFLSVTLYRIFDNYFIDERMMELKVQANIIAVRIASSNYLTDDSRRVSFAYEVNSFSRQGNYRVIIIDRRGIVLQDSNETDIGKTYLIPEVIEALESRDVSDLKSNGLIYTAVSIVDSSSDESERVGVVLLVASTDDIKARLTEIQNQVTMLTLVTLAIVVVVVIFISQIITDPLKKVSQVIVEIAQGHLDRRADVIGIDEIGQLGTAVNNMADKLEQMDASRQNFVSNVSHELKTPLSSIKVLCESILFQENTPVETYEEFLKDINSEVDRMSDIIDDLLTLVKIDQKESPLNFSPVLLNDLIGDVVKRVNPLAKVKGISIEFDEVKEVTAHADSMKLALAISNLVENSIKYTDDEGEVTVVLDSDHQNAFISVEDTGIGIEEDEISKIFERFYRVDKTRDRETGGTGLGLAITHSVVILHGGSIKVSSKFGEGSTFTIRIPLNKIS